MELRHPISPLGDWPIRQGSIEVGYSGNTNVWLGAGSTSWVVGQDLPLFALSSVLTVPSPEPATVTLLGVALFLLGGVRFLRIGRLA